MERNEKAGGLGTGYYAISLMAIAPIPFVLAKTWVVAAAVTRPYLSLLSSMPVGFSILLFLLAIAAVGTLIEAVSLAGTDNLTVSIVSFLLGLFVG
jgi:hypothetical protein